MNLFDRLKDFFAFTKNEQKVFLFLSVVLIGGVAVKAYKSYITPADPPQFDYSASDSVFHAKSKMLSLDRADETRTQVSKINLNTATKSELMSLPGIGEAMAERIMLYRQDHGAIKKIDELKKVKGIGEKKFEQLKQHIEVK